MDSYWTRRAVMGAALTAMAAPAVVGAQEKPSEKPSVKPNVAQDKAPAAPAPVIKGKLTDQSLGTLLKAMGIEAKATEQQYDFSFKSTVEDTEWDFSMSAVLSQDGSSIWLVAWLDELPKSAADVPRTALLRLLAENDKMGKGKFFAYIASHHRFVLQRVIPNENITAAAFRAALEDLNQSVVATHAFWYTPNWTSSTSSDPATAARSGAPIKGSGPQAGTAPSAGGAGGQANSSAGQSPATTKPVQSAVNDSKFSPTTKK